METSMPLNELIRNVYPYWGRGMYSTFATLTKDETALLGRFKKLHQSRTSSQPFTTLGCCGVKELTGVGTINNPSMFIQNMCLRFRPGTNSVYLLFTQATSPLSISEDKNNYGWQLANFIIENKLGEILNVTGPDINPNSSNYVTMFTWKPDPVALHEWFLSQWPPEVGKLLYGKDCLVYA